MRLIDGKYHIVDEQIINSTTGEILQPSEPLFLFRGKDRLAAAALLYYWDLCRSAGCRNSQRAGVTKAVALFESFAARHSGQTKLPD